MVNWIKIQILLIAGIGLLLPVAALAVNTPMGNVLCTTTFWFLGNAGKGLAVLTVIIVGIGARMGKLPPGLTMLVGIGIAIIFGAGAILNLMGAGVGGACTTN